MSWWSGLGRVSGSDIGIVDESHASVNMVGGGRRSPGRRRVGICQGGSLTEQIGVAGSVCTRRRSGIVLFRRVLVLRWVLEPDRCSGGSCRVVAGARKGGNRRVLVPHFLLLLFVSEEGWELSVSSEASCWAGDFFGDQQGC
jgi:hypothetical protein